MPKYAGPPLNLVIDGATYSFPPRSLDGFPEAPGYLRYLLVVRGVSAPMAVHYVKLVARMRRFGRLDFPQAIKGRVERTAVNGYWRWINETYDDRVRPVLQAINQTDLTVGVRWLRRGALVPPYAGKKLLKRLLPMPVGETALQVVISEEPCNEWTLHVPQRASAPAHTDPCPDCVLIKLDARQLDIIASAFEKAWGHRQLDAVPADAFLFGTPPVANVVDARQSKTPTIAAILPHGALATALDQLGASVARDLGAFLDRLQANTPGAVAIDFSAIGASRLDAVLMAVREAGHRYLAAQPPEEKKLLVGGLIPTNNAPLPGSPLTLPEAPPAPVLGAPPPALGDFAKKVLGSDDANGVDDEEHAEDQPAVLDIGGSDTRADQAADSSGDKIEFIDWAARSQTSATRLVHCTVHRKAHTVTGDQEPCAPGAWHNIPQ